MVVSLVRASFGESMSVHPTYSYCMSSECALFSSVFSLVCFSLVGQVSFGAPHALVLHVSLSLPFINNQFTVYGFGSWTLRARGGLVQFSLVGDVSA